MPTTIQVDDDTRRRLETLKKERGLQSYDGVVRWLIGSEAGLPASMFGAARGSRAFEREGEDEHGP